MKMIPTRDEIAAALCLGALEPDARTLRQADAVLSLLASKSETPETAKYPLKATKEMLDAAEISWNRSYEYEPYRFEKMLNAALAVVAIPLAESEQRGDRCAYVYRESGVDGLKCHLPEADHHDHGQLYAPPMHAFVPPVSPMPPLGDAAGSEDADLKALIEKMHGSLLFAEDELAKKHPRDFRICLQTVVAMLRKDHAAFVAALEARESPLPSPYDCVRNFGHTGDHEFPPPAGPAASVEKSERCKCGRFLVTPIRAWNAADGVRHTAENCAKPSPATIAPSPVDTMVSAADAFEKMAVALEQYAQSFDPCPPLVTFMDSTLTAIESLIASQPTCEDRKAK